MDHAASADERDELLRQVAQQRMMNKLGGRSKLVNRSNPIGEDRRDLLLTTRETPLGLPLPGFLQGSTYKNLKRPPNRRMLSKSLNLHDGEWQDLTALVRFAPGTKRLLLNTVVHDISQLAELGGLEELAISEYCEGELDLAQLQNLTTFWLDVGPRRRVVPGGGEQLTELGLSRADQPWIEWLPTLGRLESLRLDEVDAIPRQLPPTLRSLDLAGGRQWSGQVLEGIQQLQELHLNDMRGMVDLTSFTQVDDLRILHLEDCPDLRSLEGPGFTSDLTVRIVGSTPDLL